MSNATPTPIAQSDIADPQAIAREVLLERLLRDALESLCKAEIQRMLSTPEGKQQLQNKTQGFIRDLLADILTAPQETNETSTNHTD